MMDKVLLALVFILHSCAPVTEMSTVTNVVDGDTLDLQDGTRIRLAGIDTPENGECGFAEASEFLSGLVLDEHVEITKTEEDTDRYGRTIAYVDVLGVDAGKELIAQGYAIARYDSRDGYGKHPRESLYIEVDEASPNYC